MASITPYQTKKGRRYRVQYRDPAGKMRSKRGFTRKSDAQAWADKNAVDVTAGDWINPTLGRTTIEDVHPAWEARQAQLKPSTETMNSDIYRLHVEPTWAGRAVGGVKPSEVQTWVNSLDYSPSYVRNCHMVLAQHFDVAVRDGMLKKNPARGVRLPSKPVQPVKVYLTYGQLRQLADASKYPELIMLLGTVGLRWGEAAALRPCDLDPKRNRISISRSASKAGNRVEIVSPKTGPRSVAVPADVMRMLVRRAADRPVDGLLWPNRNGEPMISPGHNSWFSGAVRDCMEPLVPVDPANPGGKKVRVKDPSFPRVTPYGLRHVAAGLMIQAGANPLLVARQLGHADPSITMRVYASLWEDGLDVLAQSIGADVAKMQPRALES